MAETGTTFSLKYQARALAPQPAAGDSSQWVVGTNSIREHNEIRVLEYDADLDTLKSVGVFAHEPEIWDIAPCPSSATTFLTIHSKDAVYRATLWKNAGAGDSLTPAAELTSTSSGAVLRRVLWHPRQTDVALTVEEGSFRRWAVAGSSVQCTASGSPGELQQLWSATLHPGQGSTLACAAAGNNVQLWDLRGMTKVGEITGAHKMPTRDVDFAPQHEHRIVSAGDDCKLRFWDLRMLGKTDSLLELGGHSHWVWKARYSPFHDPLLVSSSSDSLINLWHTPVLSKTTDGVDDKGQVQLKPPSSVLRNEVNGKAHTYDDHEDSIYGLAWSLSDPWVFASLSYDGRVVVNKVPKNIKYKILI